MPPGIGYGKRTVKKRPDSTAVGYQTTDLGARMTGAAKGGGGIRAGAHPEFDRETPLDKVVNFGRAVVKRLRGR
jgi:hypothetical protein